MLDFRTDLADERAEICKSAIKKGELDGIITEENEVSEKINVTTVKVINDNGSKLLGKDIGNYITVNIKDIEIITNDELKQVIDIFSEELKKLITFDGPILVVGLGNEDTTADEIGPKVVKDLEITRHIFKYKPELLPENARNVCAIAPGVLGTTGMETQEIISSITKKIKPSGIIVIDALASNNISRLLKTIQISNTGITPGAGVGNKRKKINIKTMGVPVIAIGVPTIVEAATIVADTFDILTEKFEEFSFLKNSSYKEKYDLVKLVLEPSKYNLTVMPKEIDELANNMEEIISSGINRMIIPE